VIQCGIFWFSGRL